jgi:hypothetical protein
MGENREPSARSARPRLVRDVPWHVLALVIFGLLGWSGVVGLDQGVPALAVPSLIVGGAGAVRAFLAVTGILPIATDPVTRRMVRAASVSAAAIALGTGFVLAPDGMDRGFVLGVNAVLAGALAAYAFLAEPASRAASGSY